MTGSRVQVLDKQGKSFGVQEICGGDGRGGQRLAEWASPSNPGRVPGGGARQFRPDWRMREITVATSPVRGRIDEQTPKME